MQLVNEYGMVQSRAPLQVSAVEAGQKESPPQLITQLRNVTVKAGEPVTFDCQIESDSPVEISWMKVPYCDAFLLPTYI